MAEYAPILAVIAFVVFFSVAFIGPWVGGHLGIVGLSIEYGDHVAGECPTNWGLIEEEDARTRRAAGRSM